MRALSDAGIVAPDVDERALVLHQARRDRAPVDPFTEHPSGLTIEQAYAVQARGLELREADGERVVAGKLGFTSAAMRAAMGVSSPNYGWLTDAMALGDGAVDAVVDLAATIHPKVEPEIALLLGSDLVGPGLSAADVRAATTAVAICLEVVDSRYRDFRFAAADNIADDSSAAGWALGDWVPVGDTDLRLLGCVVTVDGVVTHTAAGAAAHGDPAAAVAWMANHCGRPLRAGSFVISGGLTTPVDLHPGTVVTAEVDRLGPVTLRAASRAA